MYYYLYDSGLSEKKYYHALSRIETRLTDLGINGKINRLSFLKNIPQIIGEEIKRGVKTIVIVGDDKTIGQVINLIADLEVVIGIIPIGEENNIAKFLGIPLEEKACDILSARVIKGLDLGIINNCYFTTELKISGREIHLECDDNYFINLAQFSAININNLGFYRHLIAKPNDGSLNIFIESVERKFLGKKRINLSQFTSQKIKITSAKSLPIILTDEKKVIKTPAIIQIVPQKIKVIVGKNRYF